jgi:hypothetical protein
MLKASSCLRPSLHRSAESIYKCSVSLLIELKFSSLYYLLPLGPCLARHVSVFSDTLGFLSWLSFLILLSLDLVASFP